MVDSEAFLRRNFTPAGLGKRFRRSCRETSRPNDAEGKNWPDDAAGNRHDQRWTGQSIRINSEKLRKAVGEYGVGSILNVNDEALPAERWHEIIRAIQEEAKKSRLQIPVLYGIDTIHGPNYIVGGTLFPSRSRWPPRGIRS